MHLLMVSRALVYSLSSRSNSRDRMLTCSRVTAIPVLSLPLLQLVKRIPELDCENSSRQYSIF